MFVGAEGFLEFAAGLEWWGSLGMVAWDGPGKAERVALVLIVEVVVVTQDFEKPAAAGDELALA